MAQILSPLLKNSFFYGGINSFYEYGLKLQLQSFDNTIHILFAGLRMHQAWTFYSSNDYIKKVG